MKLTRDQIEALRVEPQPPFDNEAEAIAVYNHMRKTFAPEQANWDNAPSVAREFMVEIAKFFIERYRHPDLADTALAALDRIAELEAERDALRDARDLSQLANSDDVYACCCAAPGPKP